MGKPKERGLVTEVMSCPEAKAKGLKRYFTGRPCKNGHVAERLVSNGVCLDCQLETNQRGRARDPDRFASYSRDCGARFRETHPDHYEQRKLRGIAPDPVTRAAWLKANAERVREIKRDWKRKNPEWVRAQAINRTRQLKNATPPWLSASQLDDIVAIYTEAKRLGPGWHVDHIVPLKGDTVCGLHVPWNLRVIPASENLSKGARLIDDLAAA